MAVLAGTQSVSALDIEIVFLGKGRFILVEVSLKQLHAACFKKKEGRKEREGEVKKKDKKRNEKRIATVKRGNLKLSSNLAGLSIMGTDLCVW